MLRTRIIPPFFGIAVCSGGAIAQTVQSTWTDGALFNSDWEDADNWIHSDPQIDTFPDNGNEDRNYAVTLNGTVDAASQLIELDRLTFETGGAIRSDGSSNLRVLGETIIDGFNVGLYVDQLSNGGELLSEGNLKINSGMSVYGMWQLKTHGDLRLGDGSGGTIVLRDSSSLEVLGDVVIDGDASILSSGGDQNSVIIFGAVRKTSGNGVSELQGAMNCVTAEFNCMSGEMRFTHPIQGVNWRTQLDNPTFQAAPGARILIDRSIECSGLTRARGGGTVEFVGGRFEGIELTTSDATRVVMGNGAGTLVGGGLNADAMAPFIFEDGVIGDSATTINRGAFLWSGGTFSGAGVAFRNVAPDGATGAKTAPQGGSSASRRIAAGTFENQTVFTQLHSIFMGAGGMVTNLGAWKIGGATTVNIIPEGGAIDSTQFDNLILLEKVGTGTSVVGVKFNNTGTVSALGGVLSLTRALQYNESTTSLTGGTWKTSGGGEIRFASTSLSEIQEDAEVEVDGAGSGVRGLDDLERNSGKLKVTGGGSVTHSEPEVTNDGEHTIEQQSATITVGDYTNEGTLTIADPGSLLFVGGEINVMPGAVLTVDGDVNAGETPPTIEAVGPVTNDGLFVQQAREAAMRAPCVNNVRQIRLDAQSFTGVHRNRLTIDSSCATFASTSHVQLGVSGDTTIRPADQIRVLGDAQLDGRLEITFINSYYPQAGQVYSLFEADNIEGEFDEIVIPTTYPRMSVRYTPTQVQVWTVCPADWNADQTANTGDFLAYLNDYNAVRLGGSPTWADPDIADPFGVLNTVDFLAYLNDHVSGCD